MQLTVFFVKSYLYSISPYYKKTTFYISGSPFKVYVKCKLENQDSTEYNKS